MKKIIDGKRYDTEKSEHIDNYNNGLGSSDSNSFYEGLYLTKKGAFFLAGHGGVSTIYARGNGRESWGSSGLRPVTPEEAQAWMEQYGDANKLEAVFGDKIIDA